MFLARRNTEAYSLLVETLWRICLPEHGGIPDRRNATKRSGARWRVSCSLECDGTLPSCRNAMAGLLVETRRRLCSAERDSAQRVFSLCATAFAWWGLLYLSIASTGGVPILPLDGCCTSRLRQRGAPALLPGSVAGAPALLPGSVAGAPASPLGSVAGAPALLFDRVAPQHLYFAELQAQAFERGLHVDIVN